MTDPMRDQIRSVIATVVEDAPDPIPFEQVQAAQPGRAASRGPLVAAAAFASVVVVVGAVALLGPPGDGSPVVVDPPSTTVEPGPLSENSGMEATPVRVGQVPEGLELEVLEVRINGTSMLSYGPGSDWSGADLRPQLTVVTHSLFGRPTLDTAEVRDRLHAAHGTDSVVEVTVRDRPAFLVSRTASDGWTIGLLILESDELVSEVQATGLETAQVLTVASSLETVDVDSFRQEAINQIRWDLRAGTLSDDAEAYRLSLLEIEGIEEVTVRTSSLTSRDLFFDVQSDSSMLTTTSVGEPEPDPEISTQFVDALVHLDGDADPEAVAAAISESYPGARVSSSPAIAAARTVALFNTLLSEAQLIHDDPPVHQPLFGPGPDFDTTDLGTEVPLYPATRQQGLPEPVVEAIFDTPGVPRAFALGSMTRGPSFHLGTLDDGSRLFIVFNSTSPEYFIRHYVPSEVGASTSGGGGSLASYWYGVTGSSSGPGGSFVFVVVPFETAVYTYELLNGPIYQQQPVGGHGVLPVAGMAGTVTAYDRDGNVLGSWQR
jgi:hypothetical protein